MNPGYDWASRVGNWLVLKYSEHCVRAVHRRSERFVAKVARSGLPDAAWGPSIELLVQERRRIKHRASVIRAEYDDWAAGRPT